MQTMLPNAIVMRIHTIAYPTGSPNFHIIIIVYLNNLVLPLSWLAMTRHISETIYLFISI